MQLDARFGAYADVTSPRYGNWQFTFGGYLFQQGVEDYSAWLQFLTAWYPTEKLTLRLDLLPQYFGRLAAVGAGQPVRFLPGRTARLRLPRSTGFRRRGTSCGVKWQWIGIDARAARRPTAPTPVGDRSPSTMSLQSFTVSNLGLQLRYRYEIGPHVRGVPRVSVAVVSRCCDDDDVAVATLFCDMSDVRDADQFLIKLRYRL